PTASTCSISPPATGTTQKRRSISSILRSDKIQSPRLRHRRGQFGRRRGRDAQARDALKGRALRFSLVDALRYTILSPRCDQPGGQRQAQRARPARWSACQTLALAAGMSSSATPSGESAFMIASITAGRAPTVPASPAPLAPSGLVLVGTGLLPMAIRH